MLRTRNHAVKLSCNFLSPHSFGIVKCGNSHPMDTTGPLLAGRAPETGAIMAALLLEPVWNAQPDRWDYSMAAHLLRRAGFGGSMAETQQLLAAGPEKAIAGLIHYASLKDDFKPMEFGEITAASDGSRKSGVLGAP